MSTDWIKMRVDLRTHPKVVRMASALKADKLRVIGGLFAVWSIFDAHSSDGVLEGYTFESIDGELHWKGFAKAMAGIDWLVYDETHGDGLSAPRFEEHNGQSAKRRAMETERKRLEREAEKAAVDAKKAATKAGQPSASDADKSVTREEKRREEIDQEQETPTRTATPTDAGRVCKVLKRVGISDVQPGHPDLLALIAAGATDAEFESAGHTAVDREKGFAYALGTLKRQRADAAQTAKTLHTGPMPTAPPPRQSATERQIATMNALTGKDRDHDRQRAPAADTIDIAARVVP